MFQKTNKYINQKYSERMRASFRLKCSPTIPWKYKIPYFFFLFKEFQQITSNRKSDRVVGTYLLIYFVTLFLMERQL